jgi:hypothetical protein
MELPEWDAVAGSPNKTIVSLVLSTKKILYLLSCFKIEQVICLLINKNLRSPRWAHHLVQLQPSSIINA